MASRSVGKSKARAAAVEQFGDLALGQFQHRQHHGVIRLRFGADDLDDVRNDPPFIPLRLIDTLEFDIDKIDDVVCAFSTLDGAVGMSIAVQMEPAASTSRKRRAEMLAGLIRPTKYPDLDNVVKAVIDGCSKGVIRDDVLVVEITASKAYGPTSCVDVMLREIAPP